MRNGIQAKIGATLERKVYAVDLFCGAGGLTHGLMKAGVDVRLGVDIDPACEYPYVANNNAKFLLKSVEELEASELERHYRKNGIKLLAGCAPCQTFSTYNQKATESDKRWWLLLQFSRLVDELSPDLVTMENVPRLVEQNVFDEFVVSLEGNGYSVAYRVVNCAEYGVPQRRNRLVLLASKFGPISLLTPDQFGKRPRTVKEAIGNLPPLSAGTSHPKDPLHQCSALSEINMRRIKASRPGGTWRDWPRELVADCHKKFSGKTYPSVYGRMTWDAPAPTVTTQFFGFGNGRFGHPEQDRAISLREGAILQSFPPDYEFTRPGEQICQKSIGRLIGNAVPVTLGEVILIPDKWKMCPFCKADCIVLDQVGMTQFNDGSISWWLAGQCRECKCGRVHCQDCGQKMYIEIGKSLVCECGHEWHATDEGIAIEFFKEEPQW